MQDAYCVEEREVTKETKRYKVTGFYVTEAKTMCFALEEGVQEDYRTNGKDE